MASRSWLPLWSNDAINWIMIEATVTFIELFFVRFQEFVWHFFLGFFVVHHVFLLLISVIIGVITWFTSSFLPIVWKIVLFSTWWIQQWWPSERTGKCWADFSGTRTWTLYSNHTMWHTQETTTNTVNCWKIGLKTDPRTSSVCPPTTKKFYYLFLGWNVIGFHIFFLIESSA